MQEIAEISMVMSCASEIVLDIQRSVFVGTKTSTLEIPYIGVLAIFRMGHVLKAHTK